MLKASCTAGPLQRCCAFTAAKLEMAWPSKPWCTISVATMAMQSKIPNLKPPKKLKYVKDFPERRRLKIMERTPQPGPSGQLPPKTTKNLIEMRGPETVHNKLYLKQYGIKALGGGQMHYGHFEMVRHGINRKMDDTRMFAMWRLDAPWKPCTRKGQGHRMGGGKGAVHHYVTPVREGRIIVEIGGNCEYEEVYPFLKRVAAKLPFNAEVVSHASMQAQEEEEQLAERSNINPFTFKYCVENNMLGCSKWVSPYDYKWHGRYR